MSWRTIVAVTAGVLLLSCVNVSFAKSKEWMGNGGTSVLGIGIVELMPRQGHATEFSVHYNDGLKDGSTVDSLQVWMIAAKDFQGLSSAKDLLGFQHSESGTNNVTLTVSIREAGTYLIGYGPWYGIDRGLPFTTDPQFSLEIEPGKGGNYRWISGDAGDFGTIGFNNRPNLQPDRGFTYINTKGENETIHMQMFLSLLYNHEHLKYFPALTDVEKLRTSLFKFDWDAFRKSELFSRDNDRRVPGEEQ